MGKNRNIHAIFCQVIDGAAGMSMRRTDDNGHSNGVNKHNMPKKIKYTSPLGYAATLIICAAIFAETIGMLILHHTGSPHSRLVYLDSLLIVVLLLPAVYFVVYRPMTMYIREILQLNMEHAMALAQLQKATQEIKVLTGILPICANCKKIRDDEGYWRQIEQYISDHSEAQFTHGMCEGCAKLLYPTLYSDGRKA